MTHKKEEMEEKERQKYQKKKEKGTRKLVKDMSPREHKAVKKTWKEHCTKYRAKKKNLKEITNTFIRENTPDSIEPTVECRAPSRSSVAARKKEAKKKREKILKEKDHKIQEYKQKFEKYKRRLQRLKKKVINNNQNDESPNTKLTRLCDNPSTRKDVVKKALFGEVLNKQLEENYAGLKTQKEKEIFGKVLSGKIVEKYKLWRIKDSAILYKRLQESKNQSVLPKTGTRLALISSEHMKTVMLKMLAWSCEGTIEEGKKLINTCLAYNSQLPVIPKTENEQLVKGYLAILCHQVESRMPHFSAAGYFTVDYKMLGMIAATLTSNLVVLLQFIQKDCK
ncbi:hypothetical protein WA026_007750 [Henosepilachna vigintioctopunctata]|uniref:Gustatory receptor n=1 Tax=Henosepilachna vigintioctopunctata TaxID=420089 RepID=A0AAW1TUX5_9CUCU